MFWEGIAALSFPSQVVSGFDEHLQELIEWFLPASAIMTEL